jgi:hypothetical protein
MMISNTVFGLPMVRIGARTGPLVISLGTRAITSHTLELKRNAFNKKLVDGDLVGAGTEPASHAGAELDGVGTRAIGWVRHEADLYVVGLSGAGRKLDAFVVFAMIIARTSDELLERNVLQVIGSVLDTPEGPGLGSRAGEDRQ